MTTDFSWLPIDALKVWDRNPRKNDGRPVEEVARSIRRFGFVSPIVVWTSAGRMVAGHTRLKAIRAILAYEPGYIPRGAPASGVVPVRFQEFESEAEANAYALTDNRTAELAEWDAEGLVDILRDLEGAGGLEGLGWNEEELGDLLKVPDIEGGDGGEGTTGTRSLSSRFGVPPFSVLDAAKGIGSNASGHGWT